MSGTVCCQWLLALTQFDVDISVDKIGMWQWDFFSHSVNTTTGKEKEKNWISHSIVPADGLADFLFKWDGLIC